MTTSKIETKKDNNGILKAAWWIAVVIVFSKFIGLLRDMVLANHYGASTVSDAYYLALQIPSLAIILLGGVGGPFHSATVAVFTKLIPSLTEKPPEEVNKLYSTFFTGTFILFGLLTILCYIFAPQIISAIVSSKGNVELIPLATEHFRIMTPIILFGGIIGIYYGLLVCYKHFTLPNLSPMMLSVVIILIVSFVGKDPNGVVLAWATTAGAFVQLIIQYPKIREIGFRLKPNFDFNFSNNPQFKNICELLFPAVLSSTIGQINIYIDMFFASSLREGAWTAVVYGNRIFQFPVGILVTAFLVPLFPLFSKLVAEKDFEGIKNYFNKGVGVLFFLAIPMTICILIFAKEAISIVLERGAFDARAVMMVTEALCFLSLSILPYVFRDSITRIYYSFNDSKTPFVIATSAILLKYLLNLIFITKLNMGIAGITLSTTIITLFNAVLLGLLISKKIKLDYKNLFVNLSKMLVAGGVTLVICLELNSLINTIELPRYVFEFVKICSVGVVCFAIYLVLNLLLKMEYASELWVRLKQKIKKY